ncbi:MAG: hypothetical protein VXW38_01690 [Bacteroidota bacterium]|nr:hypothetical protein [Bacteroidota bacterium]
MEFTGRPYFLVEDGKLADMERVDAQMDYKVKALGYGGTDIYFTVFSPSSPITFEIGTLPKIIIRVEENVDPSEIVTLSKAVLKKDRRRFLQGSMAFGGKARDVSDSFVQIEFEMIDKGLYQIVLPGELEPGEYGFVPIVNNANPLTGMKTTVKVSCFSIQ